MAGIWERIKPDGVDRLSVHMLIGGLKGYATGVYTRANVLDAINGALATPLDSGEQADLTALADEVDGITGATNKMVWGNKLEALGIGAELGAVNETKFRTDLGI